MGQSARFVVVLNVALLRWDLSCLLIFFSKTIRLLFISFLDITRWAPQTTYKVSVEYLNVTIHSIFLHLPQYSFLPPLRTRIWYQHIKKGHLLPKFRANNLFRCCGGAYGWLPTLPFVPAPYFPGAANMWDWDLSFPLGSCGQCANDLTNNIWLGLLRSAKHARRNWCQASTALSLLSCSGWTHRQPANASKREFQGVR